MNRKINSIFNLCDICKTFPNDFLPKCFHKLCIRCLLISWLHLLFAEGIKADFFSNSEKAKMICPICEQQDQVCKLTFEKIDLKELLFAIKTKEFDCICRQEKALFHCLKCKVKIGEKCQSSPLHQNMKGHSLAIIDQHFMTILCSCENFQPCYKYCNKCSEPVCKDCSKKKHQHKEGDLEIIDDKFFFQISSKCELVAQKLKEMKKKFIPDFLKKHNAIEKISDVFRKNDIRKKFGILIKVLDVGIEFQNLPLKIRIYLSKINLSSRKIICEQLTISNDNQVTDFQLCFKKNENEILSNFENLKCKIKLSIKTKFKFNQKGVICHFKTQEHCFVVPANKNGNLLELYKIVNGGILLVQEFPSHHEIIRQIEIFEKYIYTIAENIHIYILDSFEQGKQTRSEIYPEDGKGNFIRSMKMFRDTFRLLPESKTDNLYSICCFDNFGSVFIYHWETQKKIKEFFNDQRLCTSLAVFHDKNLKKTYFVLGYQLSDIEIWELGGANTFELVAKISSLNYCVNSIIIEPLDDIGFHLYFGFGNGKQMKGKVGKYDFNPLKQEKITELGEVMFEENQVFSLEIIEDKLLVGTYEYLILFEKNNLELSSQRKCKTIEKDKIADIVYFKNSDFGDCFATISFHDQSLRIYEV